MNVKSVFIAGLLIFIGMIIATMVGGFLLAFIPLTGLLGTIVSFFVMSLLIGFIVVSLLRRFG